VANNTNLVMMFGHAHGRYLMARMTPSLDVEDNDDRRHARSCRFSREDEVKAIASGGMEESGQGPWRAVAEP
jgi:hypothetical protein